MLDIFDGLHTIEFGLLQGEEYKKLDKIRIQDRLAYAPDLLGKNVSKSKSIIEGLDESVVSPNSSSISKTKTINELKTEFATSLASYTTKHRLLMDEIKNKSAEQINTTPYYNKTITVNGTKYSYINKYGYKHDYATSASWTARNPMCVGTKPTCPSDCTDATKCKSGVLNPIPQDKITIQSFHKTFLSILKDNTVIWNATSSTGGTCPPACKTCKKGGLGDGGTDLNTTNECTNYCSPNNYCGVGSGYKPAQGGTDCRGCAKQPEIIRVPLNNTNNVFQMKLPDVNKYIAAKSDGSLVVSSYKSNTASLTFTFTMVPINKSKNEYNITVFTNKYLSIQPDGTTQLRDKNYSWEKFIITGLTTIPPTGGAALTDGKCLEYCLNGYCGKGSQYSAGGTDCTKCNKNDSNIVTVTTSVYDSVGRISKPMMNGQPCGIAGTLIVNPATNEKAWVDVEGIKHVFTDTTSSLWNKTCSNIPDMLELTTAAGYDKIPVGTPMKAEDTCSQTFVSLKLETELDALNLKLKDLARKIDAKSSKLTSTTTTTKNAITTQTNKWNKMKKNMNANYLSIIKRKKTDITLHAKDESSGLFATSNQMHFYGWLIFSIVLVWYLLRIVYKNTTSIYDADTLTLFNWQNLILCISCIWILSIVWKWRPAWMRAEWYTLPAWLR